MRMRKDNLEQIFQDMDDYVPSDDANVVAPEAVRPPVVTISTRTRKVEIRIEWTRGMKISTIAPTRIMFYVLVRQ